uniref:Uncharacterized protein n=1 Tax=Parascaris univalens TaxID=6257 RepID=A0A915AJQ5_PARUN
MSALPIIASRIRQALDCSPPIWERELGLDRRETANAPLYGLTERLKGRAVAKAGLHGTMSGRKITCRRLDYWSSFDQLRALNVDRIARAV